MVPSIWTTFFEPLDYLRRSQVALHKFVFPCWAIWKERNDYVAATSKILTPIRNGSSDSNSSWTPTNLEVPFFFNQSLLSLSYHIPTHHGEVVSSPSGFLQAQLRWLLQDIIGSGKQHHQRQ